MNNDCIFYRKHEGWEECQTKGHVLGTSCNDDVCAECKMYFKDMLTYTRSLRTKDYKDHNVKKK